jgi:hypothetical protein
MTTRRKRTRAERIEALHISGQRMMQAIADFHEWASSAPRPWASSGRREASLQRRIRRFFKTQRDLVEEIFADVPTR